jgi:hypothetical protein
MILSRATPFLCHICTRGTLRPEDDKFRKASER